MNGLHLDPPQYDEPPDWWMNLEDALEDPDMPEAVKAAVKTAMESWNADHTTNYEAMAEDAADARREDFLERGEEGSDV